MDNLINYNGTLLNSTEVRLSPDNRGFSYGDGFFESLLVINGAIPLWAYHLERIKYSIDTLRLHADRLIASNFLFDQIFSLVPADGIYRVKISISRNSPGKYFPEQNEIEFFIQATAAEEPMQPDPNKLISIGRSYEVFNADLGEWNQIKSLSALPYVVASIEAEESKYNDLLILTKTGLISESTNSNIFAIKDSVVITPGLSTGCINGVFRQYLIQFLSKNGFEIIENELFWGELQDIDELFLTNAVQWIRPVNSIEDLNLHENIITQKIIKMVRKDLLNSTL